MSEKTNVGDLTVAQLVQANRTCGSGSCYGCPFEHCASSECDKLGHLSADRLAELQEVRDELNDLQADYAYINDWERTEAAKAISKFCRADTALVVACSCLAGAGICAEELPGDFKGPDNLCHDAKDKNACAVCLQRYMYDYVKKEIAIDEAIPVREL